MAIRDIVTRGYSGGTRYIPTRGYFVAGGPVDHPATEPGFMLTAPANLSQLSMLSRSNRLSASVRRNQLSMEGQR